MIFKSRLPPTAAALSYFKFLPTVMRWLCVNPRQDVSVYRVAKDTIVMMKLLIACVTWELFLLRAAQGRPCVR
jgi:hypothetical protein